MRLITFDGRFATANFFPTFSIFCKHTSKFTCHPILYPPERKNRCRKLGAGCCKLELDICKQPNINEKKGKNRCRKSSVGCRKPHTCVCTPRIVKLSPIWLIWFYCRFYTLASQLCGRPFKSQTLCGKVGGCLLMVGSLQYRTLANCMYWFPLPTKLPVMIYDLYSVESNVKPQINKHILQVTTNSWGDGGMGCILSYTSVTALWSAVTNQNWTGLSCSIHLFILGPLFKNVRNSHKLYVNIHFGEGNGAWWDGYPG